MSNRRDFFKGMAAFVGGIAAAKASTYIPEEEEKKETVFVPSVLTITHEGKEYHPLVVEKTSLDKPEYTPQNVSHSIGVSYYKSTIRKANV